MCEDMDVQLPSTASDTNAASSGKIKATIHEDKSRPTRSTAGEQLREGQALAQASSVKAVEPRRFHDSRQLRVRELSKGNEALRPQYPPVSQPTTEARGQREVRQSAGEARPGKKTRAEIPKDV